MKFSINKRLERLPMLLSESNPYLRARMQPQDQGDYIAGRFLWSCNVLEFAKDAKRELPEIDLEGMPEERRKIMEQLRERFGAMELHTSFTAWLGEQDKADVLKDGKQRKGGGLRPDYKEFAWLQRGVSRRGSA